MRRARACAAALAAAALALAMAWGAGPADAKPSYSTIEGDGSSWAANAIGTWVSSVHAAGMTVNFTSIGSFQGRKDFANQLVDFGVSDIGFQGVDAGETDTSKNRPYAYVPIVGGGTAFPYNLKYGNTKITNLRLSGLTVAKIFTNQITTWDDPAIKADNPGLQLPSTTITPIVHSEGSGSTAQFSRYLAKQYRDVWQAFAPSAFTGGPDDGQVEYWPTDRGNQKGANGSDQVLNSITSATGDGTIGYDEYSYALLNDVPVAKILNASGYYTAPTQFNVAVALQAAQINTDKSSPNYLLQNLDNVYTQPQPQAYPLSSYSYLIEPTGASSTDPAHPERRMNSSKRQTLADFLYYSVCQGQSEIGQIGYSSLPFNLVSAAFDQIAVLKQADPTIDLSGVAPESCNNPTFDHADLSRNYLAEIAPLPPDCDRQGATNCAAGIGIYNGDPAGAPSANNSAGANQQTDQGGAGPTDAGGGPSAGSTAPGGGQPGPSTSGGAGPSAGTSIDPETGLPVGEQSSGDADAAGVATQLAASRIKGPVGVLAPLAVLELIAIIVVPVALGVYLLRPRRRP